MSGFPVTTDLLVVVENSNQSDFLTFYEMAEDFILGRERTVVVDDDDTTTSTKASHKKPHSWTTPSGCANLFHLCRWAAACPSKEMLAALYVALVYLRMREEDTRGIEKAMASVTEVMRESYARFLAVEIGMDANKKAKLQKSECEFSFMAKQLGAKKKGDVLATLEAIVHPSDSMRFIIRYLRKAREESDVWVSGFVMRFAPNEPVVRSMVPSMISKKVVLTSSQRDFITQFRNNLAEGKKFVIPVNWIVGSGKSITIRSLFRHAQTEYPDHVFINGVLNTKGAIEAVTDGFIWTEHCGYIAPVSCLPHVQVRIKLRDNWLVCNSPSDLADEWRVGHLQPVVLMRLLHRLCSETYPSPDCVLSNPGVLFGLTRALEIPNEIKVSLPVHQVVKKGVTNVAGQLIPTNRDSLLEVRFCFSKASRSRSLTRPFQNFSTLVVPSTSLGDFLPLFNEGYGRITDPPKLVVMFDECVSVGENYQKVREWCSATENCVGLILASADLTPSHVDDAPMIGTECERYSTAQLIVRDTDEYGRTQFKLATPFQGVATPEMFRRTHWNHNILRLVTRPILFALLEMCSKTDERMRGLFERLTPSTLLSPQEYMDVVKDFYTTLKEMPDKVIKKVLLFRLEGTVSGDVFRDGLFTIYHGGESESEEVATLAPDAVIPSHADLLANFAENLKGIKDSRAKARMNSRMEALERVETQVTRKRGEEGPQKRASRSTTTSRDGEDEVVDTEYANRIPISIGGGRYYSLEDGAYQDLIALTKGDTDRARLLLRLLADSSVRLGSEIDQRGHRILHGDAVPRNVCVPLHEIQGANPVGVKHVQFLGTTEGAVTLEDIGQGLGRGNRGLYADRTLAYAVITPSMLPVFGGKQ